MLKLKLQHVGHLMLRANLVGNSLMLGKTEGKQRRQRQRIRQHHQLNGHECEQSPGDTRDSLVAQMVKRLLAMWETWVRSLGWENPLEKEMATHSSILAWRTP